MTFPRRSVPTLFFLWLLVAAQSAPADGQVVLLKPGETLSYRVGWGPLGHAGDIMVTAAAEVVDGQTRTRMTTTTATRGFVRVIYPFDGEAGMLFDPADGRLLSASASTQGGGSKTKASIAFDYVTGKASYVDHLRPERNTTLPLPDGHLMDMITSLIQTRVWALAPGDSREVWVLFDDEFYPLRITAEREETIATPKGPRKTVLLVPRMIGKPKGMFRRGGEVHVWVSADADRLPLRFEVKLKVGTAFAVLTDYRPPSAP
ncbi:MAG TPA: DUF3108 domain-containing protein [Rariglobus sp.]